MSEHRTCASGCTIRGRHRTDCQDVCDCKGAPDRHRTGCDGKCRGCLPRPAEFGQLCPWCWQRLNADIVDAPALARYLWAVAQDGTPAVPNDGIASGSPSERNILSPAVDALDGLHAALAAWAHLILDEHPDGHRMRGPDETGVRLTRTTKRLDPDVFPHHPDEPLTWIRAPEVAAVRDPEATSRLVKWLLPHLTWCSQQDWAGEMRRDVADVVRTTMARYPVAERRRAVPGMTCTVCERTSLVFDPPTPERHSAQVNCTTPGCGVIYTQQDFKRFVLMVQAERGVPAGAEEIA